MYYSYNILLELILNRINSFNDDIQGKDIIAIIEMLTSKINKLNYINDRFLINSFNYFFLIIKLINN